MCEMIHSQKSPARQWCNGQLHWSLHHQMPWDSHTPFKPTHTTHQCRWDNKQSRMNRMILWHDHPEQTLETYHPLFRDKPERRPNNIQIPLAVNLQPEGRLGKGTSNNAMTQSMDTTSKHHINPNSHSWRTAKRICQTCQSIWQTKSQMVLTKKRGGPCNQPQRGCTCSPKLQDLPPIPQSR